MKPIVEAIKPNIGASIKYAHYTIDNGCNSVGWHIHPELELVYIKNGSKKIHIGTTETTYTNGLLILVGGHIPHEDFSNYDYPNNTETVIQFDAAFAKEQIISFPEFKAISKMLLSLQSALLYSDATHAIVAPYFKAMLGQDSAERLLSLLSIFNILSKAEPQKILSPFEASAKTNLRNVKQLELIFNHVNKHYQQPISNAEMGQLLGMSPNSFCRFFKKMTAQNFKKFLNTYRLKKANELLLQQPISVKEAMCQTGFNSPSYFSKEFKKQFGYSPTKIP
ncbi:AraC family transcriptional regulator [Flavobacterium sp. ASW18X]|uniref:helix-turn-helix domain-containing protein n=1 Tax=Flavobacterium sp. ASW18X TaxID=2572595 RepID=UPI0010ADD036|nr:AraC family transcriptional regulator [Flavobacterium sp. ASW18X]TKD59232.1 helix-turn-helix transcriptional regulator [Flavobacterium sp. ASW18X]